MLLAINTLHWTWSLHCSLLASDHLMPYCAIQTVFPVSHTELLFDCFIIMYVLCMKEVSDSRVETVCVDTLHCKKKNLTKVFLSCFPVKYIKLNKFT